jgi:hypothetical protein
MVMIRERGKEMSKEKIYPNDKPSYQLKELQLGTATRISAKCAIPLGINC